MTHRHMIRRDAVRAMALLAGGALTLRAAPGMAQGLDQTGGTTRFVKLAADVSEFEVASGRLALHLSSHAGVRGFAERMVKDHAELLTSLKFTNDSNAGAPLPHGFGPDAGRVYDRLVAATGPEFDILYMDSQVRSLEEALAAYREYSRVGSVDSLKKYAVKWTPMLEEHARSARTLRGSMGA